MPVAISCPSAVVVILVPSQAAACDRYQSDAKKHRTSPESQTFVRSAIHIGTRGPVSLKKRVAPGFPEKTCCSGTRKTENGVSIGQPVVMSKHAQITKKAEKNCQTHTATCTSYS